MNNDIWRGGPRIIITLWCNPTKRNGQAINMAIREQNEDLRKKVYELVRR